MDKDFDSIEELMEYVKKDMVKTIHRNSDEIEDVMLTNIKQNVYNAYEPQSYNRRWENGGLYSRDNIIVSAKPVADLLIISHKVAAGTRVLVSQK